MKQHLGRLDKTLASNKSVLPGVTFTAVARPWNSGSKGLCPKPRTFGGQLALSFELPQVDWLIGWLIDWLTDWLTDWVIDWLIDWLIDWFGWLIGLNWMDWLIWLIDSIDWFDLFDWLIRLMYSKAFIFVKGVFIFKKGSLKNCVFSTLLVRDHAVSTFVIWKFVSLGKHPLREHVLSSLYFWKVYLSGKNHPPWKHANMTNSFW